MIKIPYRDVMITNQLLNDEIIDLHHGCYDITCQDAEIMIKEATDAVNFLTPIIYQQVINRTKTAILSDQIAEEITDNLSSLMRTGQAMRTPAIDSRLNLSHHLLAYLEPIIYNSSTRRLGIMNLPIKLTKELNHKSL